MKTTKEDILNKAKDLFLKHGVKTIGMDDIANALHISKKTIYQHFSSKDELVKIILEHFRNVAYERIDNIIGKGETPIHEHYEIVHSINELLGIDADNSVCFFQLKKYYPELDYQLRKDHHNRIKKIVFDNLTKGIEQGLYREKIDKDFISRQFIAGKEALFLDEEFSENGAKEVSHLSFIMKFLEFYFRAIVTEKGLKILENILQNNNENEI